MKILPGFFSVAVAFALSSAGLHGATALYPVVVNDRWGFIDKSGSLVINPQFDEAMSFADGLARVKLGHETGYINSTGKYVWNPTN